MTDYRDLSPCDPDCEPCWTGEGDVCICGPDCDPPAGGDMR